MRDLRFWDAEFVSGVRVWGLAFSVFEEGSYARLVDFCITQL